MAKFGPVKASHTDGPEKNLSFSRILTFLLQDNCYFFFSAFAICVSKNNAKLLWAIRELPPIKKEGKR